VVISDISLGVYSNLLSTDARCLVITLGVQCDMVDFVLNSIARSISVSRYTCWQHWLLCAEREFGYLKNIGRFVWDVASVSVLYYLLCFMPPYPTVGGMKWWCDPSCFLILPVR